MGDAGTLTLPNELNRLEALGRVLERRLTQLSAAERLDLSLRQVERLCRVLRDHGAAGLASRKRGRPSNHKLPAAVRVRAVDLVRTRYADFGPTFACEKLREQHDLCVSVETLRQWMSGDGIPCVGLPASFRPCLTEWELSELKIPMPRPALHAAFSPSSSAPSTARGRSGPRYGGDGLVGGCRGTRY